MAAAIPEEQISQLVDVIARRFRRLSVFKDRQVNETYMDRELREAEIEIQNGRHQK